MDSIHLTYDEPNPKVFVDFDIIDVTNDSEELINKLAIIRGDVYTLCKNITKQCIVINNWSEPLTKDCIKLLDEYMRDIMKVNIHEVPVFLIVDTQYKDVLTLSGKLVEFGFETADHISDFENNFLFIKTSRETHKKICVSYFKRNEQFLS